MPRISYVNADSLTEPDLARYLAALSETAGH